MSCNTIEKNCIIKLLKKVNFEQFRVARLTVLAASDPQFQFVARPT